MNDGEGFLDIFRGHSRVDAKHSSIFMAVDKRENGVREASVLADFLEQTTAHAAAENHIEQVAEEAVFI